MLNAQAILRQKGRVIYSVSPDATVLDALREMAARNCGALLVLEASRPVGIISERDYARKVILMGRGSSTTRVREIMSPNIIDVAVHVGLDRCMELMTEYRIRHLLVVNGDELAGMISIGDVVKALMQEQQSTIEHLTQYISGGA